YAPRVILAGALAGRKRFGEAIAVGEEACELMPHHAELERQLQAWRHRRLGRQPAARRAAPQLAAAAAMVAGLLGTPTAAVAQPSGAHNELGATGFMGIPILAPSTTGSVRTIRIRNNVIGGAHQLQ